VAILSTESILSQTETGGNATAAQCAICGAPMATDQRYCLECGERRAPMSSVLMGGLPSSPKTAAVPPPTTPPAPPLAPRSEPPWQRNGVLTLIAGIGVLLLAMGVGVLIGRSASGKTATAPPEVIKLGSEGTGSSNTPAEAAFSSDWPAGSKGFTVQLQTLPATSALSAVEAAKTSATAKGAKSVGALRSEAFSSLPSGNYVIYSGVYHKRAEAQKALAALKKSFPAASVVEVSNGSSAGSGSPGAGGSTKAPSGTGNNINKPAPPSVLEGLHNAKGKSYEEKSKNLPNVVSTG
jgi:hypothetical protein